MNNNIQQSEMTWLVVWLKFNVPFQHKYGYIRDESSGGIVILSPNEGRLAIY